MPDRFIYAAVGLSARPVHLRCRGDSVPDRFIYAAVGIRCQTGLSTMPWGFGAKPVHLRCRGDSVPNRFIYAAIGIRERGGPSTHVSMYALLLSTPLTPLPGGLLELYTPIGRYEIHGKLRVGTGI